MSTHSLAKIGIAAIVVTITALSASAQVKLSLLQTVDISSASAAGTSFIGNNPSAVAWDGTNAYIGGYNNSGAAANTGIVKVSNVLTTPTVGTAFGVLSTPSFRDITGLTISGNTLYASYDTGSSGSGDAVRAFDTTTGNLSWRIGTAAGDSARRGDGIAINPGFNGSTPSANNVSFLGIGSGRLATLDAATGAYIYSQTGGPAPNGAVILPSNSSTSWRALAFDTNGDLYARESNRIMKGTRTGDNSFQAGATSIFVALSQNGSPSTQDNQGLAFANSSAAGRLLFANDNPTGSTQSFTNAIKAFSTTGGGAQSITYDFGAFAAPADGNSAYSFAFASSNQTLAITDFANRQLYVFQVGTSAPEASSLPLAAAGLFTMGGAVLLKARRRS